VEPISVLGIAVLAFLNGFVKSELGKKFIESIVGKLGEKTLEAGLERGGELKRKIVERLSGNANAESAITAAEQGDQEALRTVAEHLQLAMDADESFAAELQQMADQIINIGKIEGQNVQNVYGGQAQMSTGDGTTVVQVGPNSTVNIGQKSD
jgi:hypothetical protein